MADDDLDAQLRRAEPGRWLSTRFIADPAARAEVVALYAFDHELARAGRIASNALIAEIRLTWWREALDEIFAGAPVRHHPVASALGAAIRRHGLPREPLDAMIDARIAVLEETALDPDAAATWADGVGGSAAALAARILDRAADPADAEPAGRVWGLRSLRRAGLASGPAFDTRLAGSLTEARRAARRLSPAAFAAALPAALARADLAGRPADDLGARLRLIWAVATGRL